MPDITAPNAQAYGTYEQALAQMLSGGGAIAGPLNALALNGYARQERGQYDLALQRTQALQQQEMERAAQAELAKTYLQQIAPMAAAGVSSAVPSDQFGVQTLLPMMQAADNSVINENESVGLKNNSSAIANMAEVGLLPNPAGVADILFDGGIQTSENEPFLPYMTPDATSDRIRADASTTSANAAMANASRPRGGGSGGGGGLVTVRREVRNPDGTTTTITEKVPASASPQAATAAPVSGDANEVVNRFREALRANRRQENRQ